jgi:hypothetical protein
MSAVKARMTVPTMNSPPQPLCIFKRPSVERDSARVGLQEPPFSALGRPKLGTALGTREFEALELAKDTIDGGVRRSETDRAESVRDGDRRPAKRAREGAQRLLDDKLGVHLDELATHSGEFARGVDADDDDMATLAERPESR